MTLKGLKQGLANAEVQCQALFETLQRHLQDGGLLVVSMASQYGDSAEYKRLCMQEAFGRIVQDATAEELKRYWPGVELQYVDSYFLFPSNQDGMVLRDVVMTWTRYFVRLSEKWLTS